MKKKGEQYSSLAHHHHHNTSLKAFPEPQAGRAWSHRTYVGKIPQTIIAPNIIYRGQRPLTAYGPKLEANRQCQKTI